MKEEIYHDCNKCKHGFYAGSDCTGWHNLCGAGHCYLCHQSNEGECDDYVEGDIPDGVEPM